MEQSEKKAKGLLIARNSLGMLGNCALAARVYRLFLRAGEPKLSVAE